MIILFVIICYITLFQKKIITQKYYITFLFPLNFLNIASLLTVFFKMFSRFEMRYVETREDSKF